MPHFFISYAKKDTRQLALQLNNALNAIPNITAWVDKSIKAGQSWELQIQKEIDRCDYMIVLYSPDINRHKRGDEESYILREIHYAKRILRKGIIPVMAQTTEPPMILVMEQYIDFTLPDLSLDDLINAICDEAGILRTSRMPSATFAVAKPTSLYLMPQPFAWVDIPNKGYSIAKYPVTNAQFAKFIGADGYNQQKWWTDVGWSHCQKENWTRPRYWTDLHWNGFEHPVVGISWYEAVAFCFWLSEQTDEKIMLPTEEQWQYAAQGDDRRAFPWGNDWDGTRCNNSVFPAGHVTTTPVTLYEGKGDSPLGVVDMAGNVWEWCITDYDNRTNEINSDASRRVLRGGSNGMTYKGDYRCDRRNFNNPFNRVISYGFRISRSE